MKICTAPFVASACLALTSAIQAAPADVGSTATEGQFREIYKELVETNTTLSSGSCTLAAERMAARLRAAGFTDEQLHPFAAPDHPKEGGLVAIYPGRDRNAVEGIPRSANGATRGDRKPKSILLLAHIDVV